MNPNHLLNAANVMLLLAYGGRDVLWLRLLAAAASLAARPLLRHAAAPLWPPLAWSLVFASINAYHRGLDLWAERVCGRLEARTRQTR